MVTPHETPPIPGYSPFHAAAPTPPDHRPLSPGVQPPEIPGEVKIPDDPMLPPGPDEAGQLPGMPLSHDPLLNPGPTPSERPVPRD